MEEGVCGLPLLCLKPVIEFWGIWSLRTWMKGAGTPALRPGRPGKLSAGGALRTVIFCHCFQLRQLAELDKPPGMLLQEPVGSVRGSQKQSGYSILSSSLHPFLPSLLGSLLGFVSFIKEEREALGSKKDQGNLTRYSFPTDPSSHSHTGTLVRTDTLSCMSLCLK